MNNFGDHSSHSIKVRVSTTEFHKRLPILPGDHVEIVNDHEGPWIVVHKMNDLHYYGRQPLEAPTYPNFKPPYVVPRSSRDPNRPLPSCYWGGALEGEFAVETEKINEGYVAADRLCETRTTGFKYGNHTCGFGRVSLIFYLNQNA